MSKPIDEQIEEFIDNWGLWETDDPEMVEDYKRMIVEFKSLITQSNKALLDRVESEVLIYTLGGFQKEALNKLREEM